MDTFQKILGVILLVIGVLLVVVGVLYLLSLLSVGPRISLASASVVGMSLFIFILPGILLFWLSRKLRSGTIALRKFPLVLIVLIVLIFGGILIYRSGTPSGEETQRDISGQPNLSVRKEANEHSITINLTKCEPEEKGTFWGFGGMSVRVNGSEGSKCLFEFEQRTYSEPYTETSSFNYQLYNCQIPKSLKTAEILVRLRESSTGPYSALITDAFPKKEYCEVIDSGFRSE